MINFFKKIRKQFADDNKPLLARACLVGRQAHASESYLLALASWCFKIVHPLPQPPFPIQTPILDRFSDMMASNGFGFF